MAAHWVKRCCTVGTSPIGALALHSVSSIAVNVCRDMLRSAWFRHLDRRITLEQLPEPIAQPSEEDCFLAVEVMRLPQKYREAVLLYYYEAMTTDEIAQALGVAKSTVSARLEQGRQALRKALERRRLHG